MFLLVAIRSLLNYHLLYFISMMLVLSLELQTLPCRIRTRRLQWRSTQSQYPIVGLLHGTPAAGSQGSFAPTRNANAELSSGLWGRGMDVDL